jgi:hypothetical protein
MNLEQIKEVSNEQAGNIIDVLNNHKSYWDDLLKNETPPEDQTVPDELKKVLSAIQSKVDEYDAEIKTWEKSVKEPAKESKPK